MKVKNIQVHVFDAEMHPTGIEYPIVDSVLARFVSDWENPVIVRKLPFGQNTPEEIPVQELVDGKVYLPGIIGDTHAKEGRMIYVETGDADKVMAKFPTFFEKAEDTVKLGRAFLPNGDDYGAFHGNLKIKVVKAGTTINGIEVRDGTIIVNPRVVPAKGRDIKLGTTADSFSIWQGLDFEDIKDDVERLSQELRKDVPGMVRELYTADSIFGVDDVLKADFMRMSPQLERHPWFNNSLGNRAARWINSHAFAPYLKMRCYLAIANKSWTLPVGKWLIYRHPKIAGSSLRAMTIKKSHTLPINIHGGVVASITGTTFTIKGAGPIADIGEWDIITCDQNIKIGKLEDGEVEASLVVLMRYARSALMGTPYRDFKPMNGDYDGDLVNMVNAMDIPQIFANVQKHEKDSENFKFAKKAVTSWSQEAAIKVLQNAMHSSMGSATNMNSCWLSMDKEERLQLLPHIFPVAIDLMTQMNPEMSLDELPEQSLKAMDDILQYHVQYHVDAIKNPNCDTYRIRKTESRLFQILTNFTEGIAGYLIHKRSIKEGGAYVKAFPQFRADIDPEEVDRNTADPILKRSTLWRMQIQGTFHGTPVQCFRLNKKPLEWLWEQVMKRDNVVMDPRNFSNWVPPINGHDATLAVALMAKFREHVAKYDALRRTGVVNLSSPSDIKMYRKEWRVTCEEFARENFRSNMEAATALWRVTHDTGDTLVSGAVFFGFPDEAGFIVRQWTGSLFAHRCIIVGVANLVTTLPQELKGKMEIVTSGKFSCLHPLDPVPGNQERLFGHVRQIQDRDAHDGLSVPSDGIYKGTLTLMPSGTAYFGVFEPI